MTREELLAKHGILKPVLDHGHVTFVDYMGDDKAVVDMARKSYGQGTKSVSDDEVLLRYLMRNHHSGPFEGVVAKFIIKCPIFVARQLMRHRTGAYDEVSLRYSEAEEEFWTPDEMPTQAKDNKQGSGAPLAQDASDLLRADFAKSYHDNYALYKHAREQGVSREVARVVLPVATYTEYYFVMNLRNLLHLLWLRVDGHAQKQTRAYAEAICEVIQDWLPQTWQAFVDYELEAVKLSRLEVNALRLAVANAGISVTDVLALFESKNRRERDEFTAKLGKLGVG